jgi:hypothetical protein
VTYKSKPYSDRTDLDKIRTNWKKINGLYSRREWSSSVVRAATTAEIATNLVVREELENLKGIDEPFVNHLMIWANGIQGKYQKLIMPAVEGKEYKDKFRALSSTIAAINRERNKIVHGGHFIDSAPAHDIIVKAREVAHVFVQQYHPQFTLDEIQFIEEKNI